MEEKSLKLQQILTSFDQKKFCEVPNYTFELPLGQGRNP
jgi:hypothetical protein